MGGQSQKRRTLRGRAFAQDPSIKIFSTRYLVGNREALIPGRRDSGGSSEASPALVLPVSMEEGFPDAVVTPLTCATVLEKEIRLSLFYSDYLSIFCVLLCRSEA